ncbi:hypothetical protein ACU4GD_45780 [Cupriavidus basilensis]
MITQTRTAEVPVSVPSQGCRAIEQAGSAAALGPGGPGLGHLHEGPGGVGGGRSARCVRTGCFDAAAPVSVNSWGERSPKVARG